MKKKDRILILGATGLVGSTLVRRLTEGGYLNLATPGRQVMDLMNKEQTISEFMRIEPDYVFHCAGLVGGIMANIERPVEFYVTNVVIGINVLHAAKITSVKKLMNLGSTCIYPRESSQPMKEEYLLTGKVEPTNEGYALSKIGTLRLCDYYNKQYGTKFLTVIPPNLYGEHDNFNPKHSHIVAATIKKVVEAKQQGKAYINVWGTGKAVRELMHSEDACDAMIYIMTHYEGKDGFVNIGTGVGISVTQLTKLVMKVVDYDVPIKYDSTKPDGMPIKICDNTKMKKLGYESRIDIETGIERVYDFLAERDFIWSER